MTLTVDSNLLFAKSRIEFVDRACVGGAAAGCGNHLARRSLRVARAAAARPTIAGVTGVGGVVTSMVV